MDRCVECLIFEMATVKRVYLDQIPLVASYEYKRRAGRAEILLTWKEQNDTAQLLQPRRQALRLFTEVMVSLSASLDKDFEIVALIEHPQIEK